MYLGFWRIIALKPAPLLEVGRKCASELSNSGLGGFSGFLHRQYRLHDYLLGRRNCQQFLQKHFTLPDTNPLFALGSAATGKELPIIPLVRALATVQEPLPAWPVGVFSARSIRDDLGARLKAVVDAQLKARLGWWTRHFLKLAIWLFRLRKRLLIAIVDKIDQELRLRKLLP